MELPILVDRDFAIVIVFVVFWGAFYLFRGLLRNDNGKLMPDMCLVISPLALIPPLVTIAWIIHRPTYLSQLGM